MSELEILQNFNKANNNHLIRLTSSFYPEMPIANLLGFHVFQFGTDEIKQKDSLKTTANIGATSLPSEDFFYRMQDRVIHSAEFSGMAEGALVSDGYNRDYVVLSDMKDLPLMISGALKSELKQEAWNLTKSDALLKYLDSILLRFCLFNENTPLSVVFINDWATGLRSMDLKFQGGTANNLMQRIFKTVLHDRYGMHIVKNIGDYIIHMGMPLIAPTGSQIEQAYVQLKHLAQKLRTITDNENKKLDEIFGLRSKSGFNECSRDESNPLVSVQINPKFRMPTNFWKGW